MENKEPQNSPEMGNEQKLSDEVNHEAQEVTSEAVSSDSQAEPVAEQAEVESADLEVAEAEVQVEGETEVTPETVSSEEESADESNAAPVKESKVEKYELPDFEVATATKQELLDHITSIVPHALDVKVKERVYALKDRFFELRKEEIDLFKAKVLEERKAEAEKDAELTVDEEVVIPTDEVEEAFKVQLDTFKEVRAEFSKKLEEERELNKNRRLTIIDAITEIVNNPEDVSKNFKQLRELQASWKTCGPVSAADNKLLFDKYKYQVDKYFDLLNMSRELRAYDLKKNLELKIELCEKAEALLKEDNPNEAFQQLQELHNQWKKVGPVPDENNDEVWERFKAPTAELNKRQHAFYEERREQQKESLTEKKALIEAVKEFVDFDSSSPKDWNITAEKVQEIQRNYRKLGMGPAKMHKETNDVFFALTDAFFAKRKEFYKSHKDKIAVFVNDKKALIAKAEEMKDRTDWKEASIEYKKLQEDWKKTGLVGRKQGDQLWKRFREACDFFFDKRNEHLHGVDEKQVENLELKKAILEEIKAYEGNEDAKVALKELQAFKNKWAEVGHVPLKEKDELFQEYRAVLDAHYDKLNLDDETKELEQFRSKMEELANQPGGANKLYAERNKVYNKIKTMESDVAVWENNLGFFSMSKGSKNLVGGFDKKIDQAKERIKMLTKKVRIIDSLDKE